MYDEKQYKIDLEAIDTSFKFNDKGLTHSQGHKFKLLPYAANEKTLITNLSGVVGSFSRMISNKELKGEFNANTFIEDVADKVGDYDGIDSRDVFKDIIRSMFIDGENLVDFDIKTINYIASTSADEKVAKFLYSILFDGSLNGLVEEHYDRNIENILYRLVLESLPELKDKKSGDVEYNCYIPFIKELFIEDFKFLIQNEELYKDSLKRFLEYYYMFYVSQLSMKLAKFEKADLDKPEKLYYTLSWESTSKNRTAYRYGWDLLKNSVNSLFSHAITLELVNHHGLEKQLGYVDLFNLFETMDEEEIETDILSVFDEYTNHISYKDWNSFNSKSRESGNKGFDIVHRIFEAVEYQFIDSTRTRAYEAYKNWYVKFVYENFSKKRGPLGYNLNVTEEDIILMTKICIKDKGRLKLNFLFDEFEARGMFFDRDSKMKIIQLYEKLNLLEKKSDSGDAQYVRSIL